MKRPVVMILLAGALTLSMIAPSALPAAGNVSVVHAAAKISNTSPAETSNDAAVKASNDAAVKTSNDVTAEMMTHIKDRPVRFIFYESQK